MTHVAGKVNPADIFMKEMKNGAHFCCNRNSFMSRLSAVSLLLNLEAARRGRSVLFLDEQKLLFEGGKKGFAKNTKLDFMRR